MSAWLAWISAPFHPVVDPSQREEKFGGRWLLGYPTYPTAKAKGERSMLGKREQAEDAYACVPQDPRDMMKTALSETQPPVMQGYVPRYSVCCGATRIGRQIIRRPNPP